MYIFRNKHKQLPSSQIIYQTGANTKSLFISWIKYFYYLLRAIFIASLLGIVASSISVFSYRIGSLGVYTFENVMNAVFKQPLPGAMVIYATLVTSIVFAIVFMGKGFLVENESKEGPSGFTKFMAGTIVILCLDLIIFRISSYHIYTLQIDFYNYIETLISQGTAVLLLLCLTPLYNRLIRKVMPPANLDIFSEKVKTIMNWLWFYLISLLIILCITFISTANISQEINPKTISFQNISIPTLWAGACLLSLAVALICFWPPKFRKLHTKFSLKRLLLFLICLVSVGLIYRNLITGIEIYLAVIVVTFFLSILSIPLQQSIG